ncbi:hypothetical protein BN2476_490092 [Paraburkholderia piptadeniae]|uniref:Uncharacterized protein n=1 Tax=Paraburkholderia piptadeniae TaxID=1701573 RepID=A0A1N7SF19_9BURK|nr:hypothetical protein BN2476_490092 [Paraburkholderia piptadeniae]
MSCLLLYAFSVEACCNYVGPIVFAERWPEYDRLSPMEKLESIAQDVGVVSLGLHRVDRYSKSRLLKIVGVDSRPISSLTGCLDRTPFDKPLI